MMDYKDALRKTIEPAWGRLSIAEKTDALQAIEHHTADFEGRAERIIQIEKMDEGYYGYYDHSDSSHLHVSLFALETPDEAVKTVLHEGRHAYQHDCIDNNTGFPQPIRDQFREGFDNYIAPEDDFKAYADNFTETDAEDFALQQSRLLDIDRTAALRETADLENTVPQPSAPLTEKAAENPERSPEFAEEQQPADAAGAAAGYDWSNQSTYPELGRETQKVMGGSEAETLTTDLRGIPMSSGDLQQYYDYFTSDEVARRPLAIRQDMGASLQGMGHAMAGGDEIGYYESRNHFLETDANYQIYEQSRDTHSGARTDTEPGETAHAVSARKAQNP